ncbi:MAG: Hsp20 family protein, partial [Clostridia bacterium]|nr:Hsp20 family protein [Clostridia bacterium]
TEDDIKAKFENGTLTIDLPKKDQKKFEDKKTISIE